MFMVWQLITNSVSRIKTRNVVVVIFVLGSTYLAVIDSSFRLSYANLCSLGIGGYLGQLDPSKSKDIPGTIK